IDGLGFEDEPPTAESTHLPDGNLMWSGIGSIKANATFDLGGVMDVTKVYIWNYSEPGSTPVGMKDVEVQVSHDADRGSARFTTIARIALTEGGETGQAFDIQATDVRWIRLNSLSNWGNGFEVGLAEVRFETGDIDGSTPVVVVTSPLEGDVIPLGSSVDLAASIEDPDGDLAKVEFFDGEQLLGEDDSAPYSFNVSNLALGDHAFRVKATDGTGKSGWQTVNVTVRDVLSGEVVQIDDEADIGDGLNQITYSEGWNLAPGNENDPRFMNNDHFSGNKGAWFEVRFTGAKIDIYATVASHHGTATAQIDGGTEFTISYQTDQRGEQVQVWSSPLLPNREHVLRVTVDGTGVVTADRFDVTIPNTRIIQIDDEEGIGEGENQITYSDGWNLAQGNENDPRFKSNDHYSGNKGNWLELKFTGVRVDVYATVASHHGTATATIDGGTEFELSYQTDQRGEQVFIWSSPLLPNREHTLRITVDGTGVVTADRFDVHVPTTRIVQIDDEADIGEGLNQITYSEGWNLAPGNENDPRFMNNDHYSGNRGNWFEVRFVGVQIDVYATVASHHGTGTATIDGGTEFEISYQTDQRGEQVLVWESPQLPNREHVLRVTVDGTGVVTADRFDIHVSDEGNADLAAVNRVDSSLSGVQLAWKDFGDSVVDPDSLELRIDGNEVEALISREGDVTVMVYTPATPYAPGSEHRYEVTGADTNGNPLTSESSFTIPTPPFSLQGLGGPKGRSGAWGFRQIWNTGGLVNGLAGALEVARESSSEGFAGTVFDSFVPAINFSEDPDAGAGFFTEDE
ncbi:MAG: Ig-like domain-containing protein, partial [Verrucomicrobiota bacterium]